MTINIDKISKERWLGDAISLTMLTSSPLEFLPSCSNLAYILLMSIFLKFWINETIPLQTKISASENKTNIEITILQVSLTKHQMKQTSATQYRWQCRLLPSFLLQLGLLTPPSPCQRLGRDFIPDDVVIVLFIIVMIVVIFFVIAIITFDLGMSRNRVHMSHHHHHHMSYILDCIMINVINITIIVLGYSTPLITYRKW